MLSIEDDIRNDRGFQRHLVVRGTARLSSGPDPELMDRLALKYTPPVRRKESFDASASDDARYRPGHPDQVVDAVVSVAGRIPDEHPDDED